jgi:GntR family transcriptional regulator
VRFLFIMRVYYLDSTVRGEIVLQINPNISIFIQLADYLRIGIYSGTRKPGSKIESIRDMAIELEVNPNTIKRVYQELLEEGLIETHGTLGNFVTDDFNLIQTRKRIFLNEKTRDYIDTLTSCNENIDFFNDYISMHKNELYN